MSDFVRDVIVETVRALGTSVPAPRLAELERSVFGELRPRYAGTTLRIYVSRRATHDLAARAREIRALYASGTSIASLATRYGISERQVQRLVRATSSD